VGARVLRVRIMQEWMIVAVGTILYFNFVTRIAARDRNFVPAMHNAILKLALLGAEACRSPVGNYVEKPCIFK
jgi:hypothetical protein